MATGVRQVRLPLERAISPRIDLFAVERLAKIERMIKPDLIHAHSSKAGAVARIARLLRLRTPVLYTPHGYSFAGHFSRRTERFAYRETERILSPLASRVVCVCDAEARIARSVGPSKRVRVVHNGIEPIGSGPVDSRIQELSRRGPVACAVTLLRPGKGLETLIDAMPAVLGTCPDAQLAIVGDGPDLAALTARASYRKVEQAVHFLGTMSDPLRVMRGADVFVHPSWAEAFPYVILEAMSAGLAIVASDVGGVGEAIRDGDTGLLVPRADARRLAAALGQALSNSTLRTKLGVAARARQRQSFTQQTMIDRLISVYRELIG